MYPEVGRRTWRLGVGLPAHLGPGCRFAGGGKDNDWRRCTPAVIAGAAPPGAKARLWQEEREREREIDR